MYDRHGKIVITLQPGAKVVVAALGGTQALRRAYYDRPGDVRPYVL
jgi:hypothetical protein